MSDLRFDVSVPWLTEKFVLCSASGSTSWGCNWFPTEGDGVRYSHHPHDPGLDRVERIEITVSSSLAHLCAPLQQGEPR